MIRRFRFSSGPLSEAGRAVHTFPRSAAKSMVVDLCTVLRSSGPTSRREAISASRSRLRAVGDGRGEAPAREEGAETARAGFWGDGSVRGMSKERVGDRSLTKASRRSSFARRREEGSSEGSSLFTQYVSWIDISLKRYHIQLQQILERARLLISLTSGTICQLQPGVRARACIASCTSVCFRTHLGLAPTTGREY